MLGGWRRKTFGYNTPPEVTDETVLFLTGACLLAGGHAVGFRRSFLRKMEAQLGEERFCRRANQDSAPPRQRIQMGIRRGVRHDQPRWHLPDGQLPTDDIHVPGGE